MDESVRERIERAAETHALINALKHEGEADPGAIMGPLMADHPEFRPHGDRMMEVITPVVAAVNDRGTAAQRDRLADLDPDALAELESEPEADETGPLPDLPNVESYEGIRLRCAPNPNGPWHIGNARMGAVIGTYAEMYNGWILCRFDDTDPDTKRPDLDAYDAILDDLDYLGFTPDAVIRASDRLERYYERARELIAAGGAYTCSCEQGTFSERKRVGEACPHRDKPAERTRKEFEAMVRGEYDEGDIVLRVRTDMSAPNPAERDWVALRMIDRPHPREAAAAYRCWPMLDFQSAIDDHETEITHIIRGKDLQDSAARQQYVYDYFDWTYPEVLHWGRIGVDEYHVPLSTSTIGELVAAGDLDGWDDPRAPTVQSLARRGIRGEAVTAALTELGVSTSDVDLSMSSIYAANRELVDAGADRYFLVRDGRAMQVTGDVPTTATPPRHPEDAGRGTRELPVTDRVLLEPDDVPHHDERVWLKGLGCFRNTRDVLSWTGEDITVVREEGVPVIHWVPDDAGVDVRLRTPDGDVVGRAEPEIRDAPVDDIIQFERVGFARVDAHGPDRTVAYFAHR